MKEDNHRQAMLLAEEAFLAQQRKDWSTVQRLSGQAYHYEFLAAESLERHQANEPTRSILYKSAAALALQAGLQGEAERAVFEGLLGSPPYDIGLELREILDQVGFERHLNVRDYELSHEEFQLSLQGPETGSGIVATDLFIPRVSVMERIAWRTTERMLKKDFRRSASPPMAIQNHCNLYLNATRPNCFAAIIKIALQRELPGVSLAEEIVKNIISGFDLFIEEDESGLREMIPDPDYYENFVGLAKQLAPDGKHLNFVGLTANIDGVEKRVKLTKSVRENRLAKQSKTVEQFDNVTITLHGLLGYADSFTTKSIKIELEDGKKKTIRVPEALMEDVVRPYYKRMVEIECIPQKNKLTLVNITSYDPE